jgi:hypothetical protein
MQSVQKQRAKERFWKLSVIIVKLSESYNIHGGHMAYISNIGGQISIGEHFLDHVVVQRRIWSIS